MDTNNYAMYANVAKINTYKYTKHAAKYSNVTTEYAFNTTNYTSDTATYAVFTINDHGTYIPRYV